MLSRIKYRLKIITKLLPFCGGLKRFFLLLLAFSIISTGLGFVIPVFYRMFIDEVILNGALKTMLIIVAGYLGIFFANTILSYLRNWANYSLVNPATYRVRKKILDNYFSLPFVQYENMDIGDMKMRIDDDTNQIRTFASAQTTDYLAAYLTLCVSLVILIWIDWRLAIFSVVTIPVTFLLDSKLSKREKVLNNQSRENSQKFSGWLHTSVQGWRETKALNLGDRQKRRFVHFRHTEALYFAKWINYWTARTLVIPKLKEEFFMRFGLYFLGGLLIFFGMMRISELLMFAMYYEMLSNAVRTVSTADAELQANMPYTDRLMSSIGSFEKKESVNLIIPDHSNTIVLDNVSFAYPQTDKNILHNFSLVIEKGEKIAITGKSGCGKTTLLKLITGIISPTEGTVSFSGVNLDQIDMSVLHGRIGFVMQENILFNTTIRENLLYGKSDASEEDLKKACEKAYILEFINSLPAGLDTVIGEKGVKLSGGQRQRIVLARLFLRDAEIFIFDEATSALDQYSENIVHDAIRNIAEDKTIIVVAHRDSSISLCDRKIDMS